MKRLKLIAFVLFFLVKITPMVSQIDTVFWFAAPWVTPDHWWRDDIKIHIAGDAGTVVRIRQPAAIAPNKYDTTFIIPASRSFNYTFWRDAAAGPTEIGYDSLESKPADAVRPYGLKITSSAKITAVYDVITRATQYYNPETFSLKGQNGLGTEFVCPFQNTWTNKNLPGDLNGDAIITKPKQQINIVATLPGTVVWITPRCPIVGHPIPNVTYSVAMNTGDVYTIENVTINTSTATPGQNLGGTIVVSNNPIAVTVADDSVVTPGGTCYDLIGDQIVPVDIVGDSYIANLGFMFAASVESIFVVATDNFTQVTINNGTAYTYTLNKGDTKQFPMTTPLAYVHASKPVYLWQTTGYGCEAGAAILPPLDCAGSDTVVFSRNNAQPFLLNVVCKAGNEGNFTIDGNPTLLTAADFTTVPGPPGWVGAQKQFSTSVVGIGAHEIRNSTDVFALGIINGDQYTGGLFHYMSTFRRKVNINAGPNFTVCAGATNTVALTGTISGGAITGLWTTPGGNTISPTAYTSSISTVSYIYTLTPAQMSAPTNTTITFTLTSVGNCKNVSDTVKLTITPVPTIAVTPSVITRCKNNLSPINLTSHGGHIISQTWSGGFGAFSSTTSSITTYTPSSGDASAGSVTLTVNGNGCVPVSDHVVINFTNPPTVSTPPNINVCTNTPTVAISGATITGGSGTGIWSTSGTGYFTPSDTTFNTNYVLSSSELSSGGLVTFTLTSTNNGLCAAVSNTVSINIIPKPVVSAGPDYTTCASAITFTLGGSATFNSAPTTPTWSAVSGTGAFSNVNTANTTYSMSSNDTIQGYVILVISAQGICPKAETDTIRIDILKLPYVNAGINTSVCDNKSVQLNGVITGFTGTGQWSSSGTGTFTPSNSILTTSYTPSGGDLLIGSVTFTLASTNNQGCSAVKDTLKISFKSSPRANFSIGNACVNSPVKFTDASSGSIATQSWDFGDGGNSIASSPIHTYSLANTYMVTYTVTSANGCLDTITKPIQINSLPQANFTYTNACQLLPASFSDASTISIGSSIVSWNWNFGDGQKDTINKNPVHVYSAAGLYNVNLTVISDKGCVGSIFLPVNVNPKPKAQFGMTNNPTLALETVYFYDFSTPTNSIVTWFWDFGDFSNSTIQNPTHFYLNQGNYNIILTVKDEKGCKDSITKSIEVTLLPLVPTAFSPNKDGNNDVLFVKGGPFEKMKFRVYNSWGEMVFESEDQTKGWDGTWRGQDAPIGVYVWVLDVDMFNNKSVKKTGDVTLLR